MSTTTPSDRPDIDPDSLDPSSQVYEDLSHTGSAPPLQVETAPVPPAGDDTEPAPVPQRRTEPAPEPPGDAGRTRPSRDGVPSGLGLTKFRDRLTQPPRIRAWRRLPGQPLRIRAEVVRHRFHADLPPTDVWAYEGSVPGPTIEVRRGEAVRIDWENALGTADDPAHLPFDVVRIPDDLPPLTSRRQAISPGGRAPHLGEGPDTFPQLEGTQDLTAATVVHLHGARTNGHDDGWAHNVASPGVVARHTYPNQQEATTLWYHDHAMAITRFSVYAGLAGFYLIRDPQEDSLHLPAGDHELVLAIADRNLETRPGGDGELRWTGRLLYKQAGNARGENHGELPVNVPFTSVNGTIWPSADVEACWHRLRIVNAANSRVVELGLHDTTGETIPEGGIDSARQTEQFAATRLADALVVIGTDGGLLPSPHVPAGGTVRLGPGERLDVLVDFSRFRGRTLELRNANGTVLGALPGQVEASVMRFEVSDRRVRDPFRLPGRLSRGYHRWEHRADGKLVVGARPQDVIDDHEHVWIGVIPPGLRDSVHPELWELQEVTGTPEADATEDVIRISRDGEEPMVLRPVAKLFDDTVATFIPERAWAVWHVLHLGGPEHPFHIHMAEFQMLSRRRWQLDERRIVAGFDLTTGAIPADSPLPVPTAGAEIDPIAAGMKDTWVIEPGEWVSVLGDFSGATGSFMYHCHILDHEDHTMMRPFVVLPAPLLAMHHGHGGAAHRH